MNKFLNYFTTAALILALAIFASCGGGGEEPDAPIDPCEINADFLISGTATVKKVTDPNQTINQPGNWSGFTLSFSGSKDGGSYSTNISQIIANNNDDQSFLNVWAASGSWTFDSSDANCKTLTVDGRTVNISAVSTSGLNLSFTVPDNSGRTMGIAGDWFFEFNF